MELHHLKAFVTVADEQHLTRAAERLCLSQPAISAHIKALEQELALTLFERTPKGMLPTPAGEALLVYARRALRAADEVGHQAETLRGEVIGAVRIGLNTDAGFLRLVELQTLLRERHPRLEIEFLGGTTGANLPKLRNKRLDASFVSGAVDESLFDSLVLREEEMAIAAPMALREAIGEGDVATLARLPWIHSSPDRVQYSMMQALFEPHGLQPARSMVANQKDAVLAMVAAGVGLAITRRKDIEQAAQGGAIFTVPLPLAPVPTVSLRFAVLRQRADESMLRAVMRSVQAVWAEA